MQVISQPKNEQQEQKRQIFELEEEDLIEIDRNDDHQGIQSYLIKGVVRTTH